ncbi:MAG: ligase-associated DNA damage response endonuclease PdeM [Bdellovibrionales bacterium]|nr:ligase-associated DNA damage response endonuclease PdeM [Bdellovibrionales bacterium]
MDLTWNAQTWRLLPDRALFWQERKTLILSDLHLGKAQEFQTLGIPVPSSIHYEDLTRLEALLKMHTPRRIFILGDFVHSNRFEHPELASAFRDLHGDRQWILALGNHDHRGKEKLQAWGFDQIVTEVREDGLVFCHDEAQSDQPSVNGHVHPVHKFGRGRERLRLPCFVVGERRLLLPSFGAFTGGFEIRPRRRERIFVSNGQGVVEIPHSATD